METVETIVVGAGVIGLAIGRTLSSLGHEVVVLEKNDRIGAETSSRNSEVIHAGLYYPTDSLKARFCVAGKHKLYDYAESKGIEFSRIGKLVVAIDDAQTSRLEAIARQARINGVMDIEWIPSPRLAELEPSVRGTAALWSPSTGIIDTHGLMLALHGDIESSGSIVALDSKLVAARSVSGGVALTVESAGQESIIRARNVVNAGGLHADEVAALISGPDASPARALRFSRGNYFLYSGRSPFAHLVYPIPVVGGLGIHATLDLEGNLRFGPDVEWVDEIDYSVDVSREAEFYAAIREYWPELPDGSLRPGYAGIRPKLTGPDEAPADFSITRADISEGARVVNLLGIESPGLTSCLAIADHVAELLD